MVVVDEESKERKRLYWRVCRKEDPKKTGTMRFTYPIECKAITEPEEASNFYLKPCKSCERYFYIVTDPEDDIKSSNEVQPKHHGSAVEAEPEHGDDQASTKRNEVCEPQRYIQINPDTKRLEAELVVRKHKPHSAFKLKNPQDDLTYSLSRSHWLPEASRGSRPYIICCNHCNHGKRQRAYALKKMTQLTKESKMTKKFNVTRKKVKKPRMDIVKMTMKRAMMSKMLKVSMIFKMVTMQTMRLKMTRVSTMFKMTMK